MKLIETTVSDTTVRVRFADNADTAKATQWIDLQVPVADLKHGSRTPLPNPETLVLGASQVAVLRFVRDLADAEISRLVSRQNRSS
jgi:hypothetical protein